MEGGLVDLLSESFHSSGLLSSLLFARSKQEVSVFLVGGLEQSRLLPEIGSQISIGGNDGVEGGLDKVTHGLGVSSRRSEDVFNTGVGQHLLGNASSDDTRSSGGGDKAYTDGSTFARYFGGHGVGQTDSVTPVTSSDGNDSELGHDDGSSNGGSDFL